MTSVRARLSTRGYLCAKGYNSSSSQWLSGKQVRLCSGHLTVQFGTIVEGSCGEGGGARGGRSSGLSHYNTHDQSIHQMLTDLQLLPQESTVVLQWIPARCGIPVNERADRLAKPWSKQLQPLSTSTYQEAKTLLQNRQRCQWRRATRDYNRDYNHSTNPFNRLARHEQTTIFRLRRGHCSLRVHLKRIGIMDSALCNCKAAEQTVHHIFQNSHIWRQQRRHLWPQNDSTINKL